MKAKTTIKPYAIRIYLIVAIIALGVAKGFGSGSAYGDRDVFTSAGINAIQTLDSISKYLKAKIAGINHCTALHVGTADKRPQLLESANHFGEKLGAESIYGLM